MYFYKAINSNYIEFFGYDTSDKLIWTSGKGCSNANIIIKQGIPKRNMNVTFTSENIEFGCSSYIVFCDILLVNFLSQRLKAY